MEIGSPEKKIKIVPVEEAYRRWGDRVAILGGVDMDVLGRGTEAQVRTRTRAILEVCAAQGTGYCLGTGNTACNYIPLDNYLVMLDEGRVVDVKQISEPVPGNLSLYPDVNRPLREAVHRGSMERLAPVLMTALTAGLGLVPLALGGSQPGNEIQTPLAIVVVFGLFSSTVLNMVVVPSLFLRWAKSSPPAISSSELHVAALPGHSERSHHTHRPQVEEAA